MSKKRRLITAVITAMYIFILLFSVSFIATEANHNCHVKDSCPICYQINVCNNVVKNLTTISAAAFIMLLAAFAVLLILGAVKQFNHSTLVALKVKLSS